MIISISARSVLLWLFLLCQCVIHAQPPPQQKLGEVLMLVLDKNKDQKVTTQEVESQLEMLESLFQEGDEDTQEYQQILKSVQSVATQLFDLLDSNSDKKLTKKELSFFSKFESSLKKDGKFKPFIRDCFELLDQDGDDSLSKDEWLRAREQSVIAEIAVKFHNIFPLRKTPQELEEFVQQAMAMSSEDADIKATELFNYLDSNGDGMVQRKEVGSAYSTAGKKFVEISKTIKQMGPMLAMFGGGAGGPGMRTEF
ncbi:expressed unknown protein [Seminavis robusta]|uniref:EF-hand domain-containing protein n=1 Tax=Seminavis robusta TaxID=568900 RepID=A0A9N8HPF1_9STRA|nr:expressed unknown protein [Seminavis robusta]|eukprot:Sro1323_g262630.1 n/a (255) ;mRNA; f:6044-6808